MTLEKYSIGIGDRFGHQGVAQLRALQMAAQAGVEVVPVWNKSNREHSLIGTQPADTRIEADNAVASCNWKDSYYVDADHIGLKSVDRFLDADNFFTIDVADFIGTPASERAIQSFVDTMAQFKGRLEIPAMQSSVKVDDELIRRIASKYFRAIGEAQKVYRHIVAAKGADNFIPEISVDESNAPQTPDELFFILALIAHHDIPIQTIAPKFTGSFLKGVDYVGDIAQFTREFENDLAVIAFAVKTFGLPANLKLSVHSGSDKFSLYPIMHRAIKKNNAGLHLKTAGTTWLEEVIGLASVGGEGLKTAKEIYTQAFNRYDEMCAPYLAVVHIDRAKLPHPQVVESWTSDEFVTALRHDESHKRFDSNFRQLIHVGFRVAAEMGTRYTDLLKRYSETVGENVTENIYRRHLLPLFVGELD